MKKILHFIDENILLALSLLLLAFIPLYPKWPMFDVLPGYNVRVRLEDFLVLVTFMIWGVWVLRGKIQLTKIPLFKPILIYMVIGFLSTLSAIFITKTVTTESYQLLKIFFHLFRRLEYFSLFFIFFSAVQKKEQIKAYIGLLIVTVTAVTVYGFGQKYLYWPAYSTMNREFAKGMVLYLTEHARVLSTFGGHYDLAAYVMLTLTMLIPLIFLVKNRIIKVLLIIITLAEYWLLNLTASRTSFIAFLVSISLVFALLVLKKNLKWVIPRWLTVMVISLGIMLTIGPLSERFSHIVNLPGIKDRVNKALRPPPENGIALRDDIPFEEQLKIVATDSDIPPSPKKPETHEAPTAQLPKDVYEDPYKDLEATGAAEDKESTESGFHADYSENALKYGLSAGIRMDALWPRALAAFQTNPLLGTGYSTLVKTKVWEQTTAESTDNDYLRLLGETGLLGFGAFLAILVVAAKTLFIAFKQTKDPFFYGLFASGIGLIAGIMLNALYIDVFESSKVAYALWSFLGFIVAAALLIKPETSDQKVTEHS